MITNTVLDSFLLCEYKAYLKYQRRSGKQTEYDQVTQQLAVLQRERFHKSLRALYSESQILYDTQNFRKTHITQPLCLIAPHFKWENCHIMFDALIVEPSQKADQGLVYIPIDTRPVGHVRKADKLFLVLKTLFVLQKQRIPIHVVKIACGQHLKQTRIALNTYAQEVKMLFKHLMQMLGNSEAPRFYRTPHCQMCEFSENCQTTLKEQDDLSLLGGLKPKEILKQNNRGIFTITQYSYTYKPRKRKKGTKKPQKFEGALKALALREQQTYVKEIPTFSHTETETELYVDFEGLPDEEFIYLIGVLICEGKNAQRVTFWANSKADEANMFTQFFMLIARFQQFTLYHYGSYEMRELKKFNKKHNNLYDDVITRIAKQSVNILSFFHSTVYPPTYTNTLKDVAQFLGFTWSMPNASGLQSIVWRKRWEHTQQSEYKAVLIQYNMEDCGAVKHIKHWLAHIKKELEHDANQRIVDVADLPIPNGSKRFSRPDYHVPEFKDVTRLAYFDYQHSKVFVRTHTRLQRAAKRSVRAKAKANKIDKIITIAPTECPNCSGKDLYKSDRHYKIVIDLHRMKYGVKKWIVEVEGLRLRCKRCGKAFCHEDYLSLDTYGDTLKSWCINQMISYRNTVEQVEEMLWDMFKIHLPDGRIAKFTSAYVAYYAETIEEIQQVLLDGPVIHLDETKVSIRGVRGYVWILTNLDTVLYLYRSTRETAFLKEMLQPFDGVAISDFYPGYDGLPCLQQKCLVHLIRDLNDDLFVNQLNAELKDIASNFGKLLQKIVTTIDDYGLKQRHLNKHTKDVAQFYTRYIDPEYESELAIKYQKRFKKYKEHLFTFLSYDGIPWNNNNAEHAVKPFAARRRTVNGLFTEKSVARYLVLLSIQQTCKYRGLNFLNFLNSRETSLEKYSRQYIKDKESVHRKVLGT